MSCKFQRQVLRCFVYCGYPLAKRLRPLPHRHAPRPVATAQVSHVAPWKNEFPTPVIVHRSINGTRHYVPYPKSPPEFHV